MAQGLLPFWRHVVRSIYCPLSLSLVFVNICTFVYHLMILMYSQNNYLVDFSGVLCVFLILCLYCIILSLSLIFTQPPWQGGFFSSVCLLYSRSLFVDERFRKGLNFELHLAQQSNSISLQLKIPINTKTKSIAIKETFVSLFLHFISFIRLYI